MVSFPSFISMEPELQNIKMIVAYDGTCFLGWQETKEGPSIEATLKSVLTKILQEKVHLQAASRTDAGVHALGQVVQFFTRQKVTTQELQKSLNALLPPTIRILKIEKMELSFHPTLDAKAKEYRYHVYRGKILSPLERHYCWHIYQPLCLEKMQRAFPYFMGKKNFSSFTNLKNLNREVFDIELFDIRLIEESNEKLTICMQAEKFLYRMARNIVGTLIFVGLNKIDPQYISKILQQKDRKMAAMTAPALGLTLQHVFYDW